MKLRALLSKEVYIRLTENEPGLVASVKYGRLCWKQTEYPIELPAECPVTVHAPVEKRLRGLSSDK